MCRYYLDDPFKATAHHPGSRLLEDEGEEEDKKRKEVGVDAKRREGPPHARFAIAVVGLTLTLTFVSCAIMVAYCPAAFQTMCPR